MSADTLETRQLGRTGLKVTPLCVGGALLGSMPETFGYEVPLERALATLRRAFAGPINFLDTSNNYGGGESERRIGIVLRELGGVPDGFVLATKVDPDEAGDYSGERVRRSFEESLERLGISRVPLVYLRALGKMSFEDGVAPDGPLPALIGLQSEGIIDHLGVSGGSIGLLRRYLDTGAFDVAITHNRYTLVDQSAEPLLDEAAELGIAVVNGAPFGGGVLAKGPGVDRNYAYKPAADEVLGRIEQMEDACRGRGIPLAAAALQFSLREPRIASTIVGGSRPERIDETLRLAQWPIPDELWDELRSLAAPREYWLG